MTGDGVTVNVTSTGWGRFSYQRHSSTAAVTSTSALAPIRAARRGFARAALAVAAPRACRNDAVLRTHCGGCQEICPKAARHPRRNRSPAAPMEAPICLAARTAHFGRGLCLRTVELWRSGGVVRNGQRLAVSGWWKNRLRYLHEIPCDVPWRAAPLEVAFCLVRGVARRLRRLRAEVRGSGRSVPGCQEQSADPRPRRHDAAEPLRSAGDSGKQ